MAQIYIGVGSNIDCEHNIQLGIRSLHEHLGELVISPVYESKAHGFKGANFYNLVVGATSTLRPERIAEILHQIEIKLGRTRNNSAVMSRTLDLDLLLYDDLISDAVSFQIPREDITEYAFVLRPLADIAGDQVHPVMGESFSELWRNFNKQDQQLWQIKFDPVP